MGRNKKGAFKAQKDFRALKAMGKVSFSKI